MAATRFVPVQLLVGVITMTSLSVFSCHANAPTPHPQQKIKKQTHTHFLAGLGKAITKLSASQIEFKLTLCGDVAVEHW